MSPKNREIVKAIAPDYLHTAELHGDSYMTPELLDQIMQAVREELDKPCKTCGGVGRVMTRPGENPPHDICPECCGAKP